MSSSLSDLFSREIPNTLDWPGRFRLTAGVVIAWALFWWGSWAINLPPVPGMSGSLLTQSSPAMAMGFTAAALIVACLLGRFIVGELVLGQDVQVEGGLISALIGMFALVGRIGPVRYALFGMPDPRAFILLAAELMLLYALVGICWVALQWTAPPPAQEYPPDSWKNRISALAMHEAVTTACMIFLTQSEAVQQSLAAVGISAFLASMAAHVAFPVRSSFWYWISPLLVGVAGYVIAYCNPSGLAIGFADNALGALARPSPLAYAAAGPVGAIFGFWVAYRWNTEMAQQA
jgi:hypothetical protein